MHTKGFKSELNRQILTHCVCDIKSGYRSVAMYINICNWQSNISKVSFVLQLK